jgi:hypothetical protein
MDANSAQGTAPVPSWTFGDLLAQTIGPHARFRGRLRRCFMNGKPCSYCSRPGTHWPVELTSSESEAGRVAPFHEGEKAVFVVMPFRPNLDTFFDWSLRPYLMAHIGDLRAEQIRRADQYRNIGYVMCEKICRRIQDASLVAVDLSLDNPNVFYELGLAVGLDKPLLVLCDEVCWKKRGTDESDRLLQALGLAKPDLNPRPRVLLYPNVGFIEGRSNPIETFVTRVQIQQLQPQMRIVPLLVWDDGPGADSDDIGVTFEQALKAALGVALRHLHAQYAGRNTAAIATAIESLEEQVRTMGQDHNPRLYLAQGSDGKPRPFDEVASQLNSAFACIIDLAGEHPLAYFWLGYCHARSINVIPICRDKEQTQRPPTPADALPWVVYPLDAAAAAERRQHPQRSMRDHALAFDIRALWYIDYRDKDARGLVDLLQGVFEELITRDVPRRERSTFWERLTRQSKVHIFTAALHNEKLTREMVGDWDLRAVSELVRYLSSTDESVVSELEPPIYGPSVIAQQNDCELLRYLEQARSRLKDRNCLIIASPDVNPLAEVVLARAYDADSMAFQGKNPSRWNRISNKMTIALKGSLSEQPREDTAPFAPFFSRYYDIADGKRGFLVDGIPICEDYRSQKETSQGQRFAVLGHLVVMRNLFSEAPDDSVIVLLNGVSGPATFGLAEILTGGADEGRAAEAEKLLRLINDEWDRARMSEGSQFRGVEMLVKVTIEPGPSTQFADARTVSSWEVWRRGDESPVARNNPQAIIGLR